MNIWLHRISHHSELSYPLLQKGYLSIGFSALACQDFIESIQADAGMANLNQSFINQWGRLSKNRFDLWRFIVDMKIGDWVVVPSPGNFSIYEINGNPEPVGNLQPEGLVTWNNTPVIIKDKLLHHQNGTFIDLGFTRKVTPIQTDISRYLYADTALTSRMKVRTTNSKISILKDSIDKAISAARENKPINLHSLVLDATQASVIQLIREEINPDKFEQLVAWYFRQVGASDIITPAKNESNKQGDADIVATFEPLKTIFYIQAKHHHGISSDWATQQILDYRDYKKDEDYSTVCWVVSSADAFSDECVRLAKESSVQLINGPDLARMIIESGIENLDKAF
jgi:predicted Mrr-cat superfamily restriction endonuclease